MVVPEWLGWLIGLSPLIGLAWFGWRQRGYLRRLRAEQGPRQSRLEPGDPDSDRPGAHSGRS